MDISDIVRSDLKALIADNLEYWKSYIDADPLCRKRDYCNCGNNNCLLMQLTVGLNDQGTEWSYQTGDNSFTGGAYSFPIWAVIWITEDDTVDDVFNALMGEIDNIEVYEEVNE